MEETFHAHVCGLTLGRLPQAMQFHAIAEHQAQRGSELLYYKPLVPPATMDVYVPLQHQAMIARLYAGLGLPRPPGTAPAPDEPSALTVSYARVRGIGTIRVQGLDATTAAEVCRACRDLCEVAGAALVVLELPLTHPATPALCAAVEAAGFFFAGIGPHFAPSGDVLRLQYLHAPVDTTRLQIASPFAQELLDYVVVERARRSAATASGAPAPPA